MDTKTYILLALFLSFFGSKLPAQDSTRTSYFPYQTGDFWVYEENDPVKQEVINEIKYRVYADSIDGSGTAWVHIEIDDNRSIDSVYYKVNENGDVYFNEYFDVELKGLKYEEINFDERWVGGFIEEDADGEELYAVFTLRTIDEISFFGEKHEQRIISLTVTPDTTCENCGLDPSEDAWIDDFGVIGRGGYEGGAYLRMKGAWKEGEVFGDTTFNEIVVDTLRSDYFPYETGDFWVYNVYQASIGEISHEVKYRVYTDSLDTDSTKWVYVEKNVNGQMDSVYYKVTKDGDIYSDDFVGTEMLKFKFNNTVEDDYWVGGELVDGNYGVYQLSNIGIYDLLNTPQMVFESRNIDLFQTQDSTDNYKCCGEKVFQEFWVAGFGLAIISDFYKDNQDFAWDLKGVFKKEKVYGDTTFNIITSNESTSSLPAAFKLHQNYPNPFNPTTNITFTLPANSQVSLVVYDLLGREVTTLVNNKLAAGEQTIRFDASSLANGIYLYQLRTANEVITKKMTLIK